jgi:hypothetical protein
MVSSQVQFLMFRMLNNFKTIISVASVTIVCLFVVSYGVYTSDLVELIEKKNVLLKQKNV